MAAVTKIEKGGNAKKKGENYARLLIGLVLCPLFVILHQINGNAIGEVILMRNWFHDKNKKVQELVTMGVKILLVY